MKRGQVFVRGRLRDGSIGNIDALDLDDASFRAFVLDRLMRWEMVVAVQDHLIVSDHIRYQERESAAPDPAGATSSAQGATASAPPSSDPS